MAASSRLQRGFRCESPAIIYLLRGLAGLLVLLQLIPLPASIWNALPGRSGLGAGLALIGESGAALPLSETPYRSVTTLFAVIPGLAIFVAVKMLRPSPRWLAFAIVAGMACGIALGGNHMGTLLIVSIPFAAALLVASKSRQSGSAQGRWAVGIAALILILVGIALNGSLAAVSLAVPVLLASAALIPAALRWRSIALPLAGVALAGGVVLLAATPIATAVTTVGADTSISSRQEIWSTALVAIRDSFPVGTGLGSFEQVYRHYENPTEVTTAYMNHAHNDYLQLVLELGAPGLCCSCCSSAGGRSQRSACGRRR